MPVLIDVAGNDEIDGHPEECAIRKGDDEYAPDAQYLDEPQNPR